MIRLRLVAAVNPPTPEFDRLPDDASVPFVPLDAVWPNGLDASGRKSKTQASTGYTRFLEGDIVVPKITPTFQADRTTIARGLDGGIGVGTTELHVVRPGPRVEPRYIRYLLSSRWFLRGGEASMIGVAGQKRVPDSWLRDLPVPVEELAAQRGIANFLDDETARIDGLVAKKRRLIGLLQARPVLLAEEAVRSLRSESASVPLKFLVTECDDRLGDAEPPDLLAVSIHLGVVPRAWMTDKLPRADELTAYKVCRRDDVVVNRMRAFQGGVGVASQVGIVSPDYTVLRLGPELDPRFLHHLMRSPWFVGEMTRRLRGIGSAEQGNVRTPRVNFGDLGLIKIPVPPMPTQRDLVRGLDDRASRCNRVADLIRAQIELLAERRQALITAAVTGELPVPGAAA